MSSLLGPDRVDAPSGDAAPATNREQRAAIAILLAFTINFDSLKQPTNSHAATRRGIAAYDRKAYAQAAEAFAQAGKLAPSPATAYNLGTAAIATGRRSEGSAILGQAAGDAALRADALYNRGTSALASSAYEYAIRDYKEVLRLRPNDMAAKRNLEIALAQKRAAEQSAAGKDRNPQGANPNQQRSDQKPAPGAQPDAERKGQHADAESLLRSVQQQEQEELSRMRRGRAERGRVGW